MLILLTLIIVGMGLLLPLGKIRQKNLNIIGWVWGLGIAGVLVLSSWLSSVKQVPTKDFLAINGLKLSYTPLLFMLPFFLYQPLKDAFRLIRLFWKEILLTIFGVLLLSRIFKLVPQTKFATNWQERRSVSVIPSYGSKSFVKQEVINASGVETMLAHQLAPNEPRALVVYTSLVLICLIAIGRLVTSKTDGFKRWGVRKWLALGISTLAIMTARVRFDDSLPLLVLIVLVILFGQIAERVNQEESSGYAQILAGLVLSAMLTVNPVAVLWAVTPVGLILAPKYTITSWFLAIVLNPLLIGRTL